MTRPAANRTPRLPLFTGILVAALVVLALLWDWNWFKPLVERQASSALGRPVAIGHFDVRPGWRPVLEFDGVRLANPPGFKTGSVAASVQKLRVQLDIPALWYRELRLPLIEVVKLDADLYSNPQNQPNWKLVLPPSEEPGRFTLQLGQMRIRDSRVRFRDEGLKADFTALFRTLAGNQNGEDLLRADLNGRYGGEPIEAYFLGGSLLGLRDPAKPYPVQAGLKNGATRLALGGSIEKPLALGGARLQLQLKGPNLAALYALTGIPFPQTPPYKFASSLAYGNSKLLLRNLKGALGSSDIAGQLDAGWRGGKPSLSGRLASQQVLLSDLAGFIGGKPTGEPQTAAAASTRVLPASPFNLPKLRSGNVDLHYSAAHIEGEQMPLDELSVHLLLEDGRYAFRPLQFSTTLSLDGREAEPQLDAVARFRQVDASKLLETATVKGGGTVGGRIALKSRGNSVAALLGNGNGEAQLFMQGGNLSALLVNLAGLDLGNSLLSLIGVPRRTDVRCVVADFGLSNGLLGSRLVLADTTVANLRLEGQLDFKQEALDFRLHTEPKRLNLASLAAPIRVKGTLKDPSIRPDFVKLGTRTALAAAAGTLLAPLAALIPTLQLGLGDDNNCQALIGELREKATKPVQAPRKK